MGGKKYDLIIVGAGVTGTALAYVLSSYSNVKRILILEKNSWVAEVNSNPMNNAQTSHDGGTETNYTLHHALEVKAAATMLRRYVLSKNDPLLSFKTHRMVLGVGAEEVETLKNRYMEFWTHYPDLSLIGPEELSRIEPMLMKGRGPKEPVCGLVSNEGYMINYQRLAESMLSDARVINPELELVFNVTVDSIRREEEDFVLETSQGRLDSRVVVFAAGSYSLYFAQQMGYGTEYAILPVAGSFYSGGNLLKGKVYRVQIPGMPFAAIHGDPDILNLADTRFGPTTKPLPLMERHRYKTFFDFIKLPLVSLRGFLSMTRILASKGMIGYVIKNTLYDLPIIGPWLFLRAVRPIVPTIRYRDLKLRRGAGGIRPQIVDLRTKSLVMGDVTITGDRCIFNTTPSPGASVCLANAKRDAAKVVKFLGNGYTFCQASIDRDLG
ncbi:MAG: malate dehydrogenase [Parcubacteria group bacterium Gr01-1014_20]|nr:MAG: malate dehydrogenase [Parcubacteria group bacterium Gr01-1014_20]